LSGASVKGDRSEGGQARKNAEGRQDCPGNWPRSFSRREFGRAAPEPPPPAMARGFPGAAASTYLLRARICGSECRDSHHIGRVAAWQGVWGLATYQSRRYRNACCRVGNFGIGWSVFPSPRTVGVGPPGFASRGRSSGSRFVVDREGRGRAEEGWRPQKCTEFVRTSECPALPMASAIFGRRTCASRATVVCVRPNYVLSKPTHSSDATSTGAFGGLPRSRTRTNRERFPSGTSRGTASLTACLTSVSERRVLEENP
jgi:hypothetical protein